MPLMPRPTGPQGHDPTYEDQHQMYLSPIYGTHTETVFLFLFFYVQGSYAMEAPELLTYGKRNKTMLGKDWPVSMVWPGKGLEEQPLEANVVAASTPFVTTVASRSTLHAAECRCSFY